MRTTLALDDDAFLAARDLAQREHIALGKAVSKLIRQGVSKPLSAAQAAVPEGKYGIYPRRGGALISSDDVYRLMDQEGI